MILKLLEEVWLVTVQCVTRSHLGLLFGLIKKVAVEFSWLRVFILIK